MKFEQTFDFDYPADVVLRMFGDREYYLAKYERMGGDRPEVIDSQAAGPDFSITVRHALDAANLKFPDFLKSRIGDKLYLRQTDSWNLAKQHGRIQIEIEKTPVKIDMQLTLADKGESSQLTIQGEIKAAIPLIGGKIEKAVEGPITKHTRKDLIVSNKMAADYVK